MILLTYIVKNIYVVMLGNKRNVQNTLSINKFLALLIFYVSAF